MSSVVCKGWVKGLLVLLAAGLLPAGTAVAGPGPGDGEADLGHHGQVVYENGRLGMRLRTWNHGPGSLASGAVRVSFSAPVRPVGGELPGVCRRLAPAVLVCETGELRAGASRARTLALDLTVAGAPAEVVVEVRTQRMGATELNLGTRDLNPGNDRRRVLAPATGDVYYF